MKIFLKTLVLVLFLTLAVWAIRSDSEPEGLGVTAAPLAAAGGALAGATVPPAGDAAWRRSALWDDGKAEYCAYDVSWARYGHRFPGSALLVLVKEPWAPDLDVKADAPRPDGFDVLKLNHVRDVPTGIYAYHQMASVFLRRDSGALVKLTATSAEACGIASAQMRGGKLSTRSYFDGEGERTASWPAGALPEDGLPAYLRDYVADAGGAGTPATLVVFPALMASRFARLEPTTYQVARNEGAEGVEIRLAGGSSFLAYTFEKEPPHRLLRFERDDGTTYRMAKCDRLAYWDLHGPGDEAWWPEGLR